MPEALVNLLIEFVDSLYTRYNLLDPQPAGHSITWETDIYLSPVVSRKANKSKASRADGYKKKDPREQQHILEMYTHT